MITRQTTIYLLIGALLTPAAIFAADSYQDRSAPKVFVKNSPITARIRERFNGTDAPGLSHVKVATDNDGFVRLKGYTRSRVDAERAADLARYVDGVTFVENDIHVAHGHAKGKAQPQLSSEERVEARIKTLHDRLKITPEQETAWAEVAGVMRANEAQMDALIKHRTEQTNMTAVENLDSYADITDEHADSIRRFTPVFSTLYEQMSADQKKLADDFFNRKADHVRRA